MFEQAMSDSRGSTHAYIYSAFLSLLSVWGVGWIVHLSLSEEPVCMLWKGARNCSSITLSFFPSSIDERAIEKQDLSLCKSFIEIFWPMVL